MKTAVAEMKMRTMRPTVIEYWQYEGSLVDNVASDRLLGHALF